MSSLLGRRAGVFELQGEQVLDTKEAKKGRCANKNYLFG